MRYLIFVCSLICFLVSSNAQTVFYDDFELHVLDTDLATTNYTLKKNSAYEDDVTAIVKNESSNQHAAIVASASGQANMQFLKQVSVEGGRTYKLSLRSMSPFKRHLRVYNSNATTLIKAGNDFTPTELQKAQWIEQDLIITVETGVSSLQLGIYHNWSGTLLIDDFKLELYEVTELSAYYLSSSEGDDANDGTIDSPWKTLDKISNASLKPGNTVNFKCGDRFDGHFVVNGSGTNEAPILITSYGEGDKPIITGEVGAEAGGDYQEAIYVLNNDNIIFDGLEVNNERTNDRAGVDEQDAFGIYIHNTGTSVMYNFILRNMTFKNVYAPKPILQGEGEDAFNGLEVAAVRIFSEKNKVVGQEKNIQDVLVENCYFTDLQRLGVHIKHAGGANGVGDDFINCNANSVFRNNEFHYTGGTCVLPILTYNCLIEDNLFNHPGSNVDPRMPNRGSSVWTWRCHNTVIQRNHCISTRGYLDSHGIHIDHENHNTFVQYNYMEDCEGGFVEILGGNVNAVYRFNVSVNDGWRDNPNWKNSNHTIWINQNGPGNTTHYCDYSYIYNNTVISDVPYATAIDMNGKNTFIYNNLFYAVGGAEIGKKQVSINNNNTPLYMSNNLFYGSIDSRFTSLDENFVNANPQFVSVTGEYGTEFQLLETSPAIDAGVSKLGPPIPGAGEGIFKDVSTYPTVDYYGNPVDLSTGKTNIGACNAKDGSASIIKKTNLKELNLSPNPTDGYISIKGLDKPAMMTLCELSGNIMMMKEVHDSLDISMLSEGVYILSIKGYEAQKVIKN